MKHDRADYHQVTFLWTLPSSVRFRLPFFLDNIDEHEHENDNFELKRCFTSEVLLLMLTAVVVD